MSSSVITTTGPLEVSGFMAGVSVDGPIASLSARLRAGAGVGAVGFEGADRDTDSDATDVD